MPLIKDILTPFKLSSYKVLDRMSFSFRLSQSHIFKHSIPSLQVPSHLHVTRSCLNKVCNDSGSFEIKVTRMHLTVGGKHCPLLLNITRLRHLARFLSCEELKIIVCDIQLTEV